MGDDLVLTEDILSAIRVGEVTEAWSLLGTSLEGGALPIIAGLHRRVRVWLDPDVAEGAGLWHLSKELRAYGVDATAVRTLKDPKFYNKEEIEAVLGHDPTQAVS